MLVDCNTIEVAYYFSAFKNYNVKKIVLSILAVSVSVAGMLTEETLY